MHVLAAIIAIGPVTVAASMFPAALRRGDGPALRTLHRICRVYAALGVVVPVFGLATATSLGVLGDTWLLVSIGLTVAAAGVLGLLILPAQERALTATDAAPAKSALRDTPSALAEHTARRNDATPAGRASGSITPLGDPPIAPSYAARDQAPSDVDISGRSVAGRLGMLTGVFNLLWATVVVLMIVRPGSTTGV